MLELSPFDLVLTFDADVYFYCLFLLSFFSFCFSFLFCQIGFARKTAEGEYLNLHLNIKDSIFLELRKITT